ncbi:hypothetical protein Dimus_029019 [Dionaea muscipula]
MAKGGVSVLALVLVSMIPAGAMAQSSSSCTNVLTSLSPCLNYITGSSSTPSSGCCTQLASVVKSQAQCLCEVLNASSSSLGININQTRALDLPSICTVQTPAISQCSSSQASSPNPSGSPTVSAESPSSVPSSGSGSSNTVPTTENGTSDGSSNRMSLTILFCLVTIVSYASTFTHI